MNHEEKAQALFLEGCNCAQAVFAAFCDVTGFSRQEAMRLASSFGGGVGRMREICGALSGAFLAMGWLYGYEEPGDDGEKAAHYARVQELAAAFRERHGAIQCRGASKPPGHRGHTHPADGNLLPGPPLRQAGPGCGGPIGAVYGELSEGVGG